MRAIRLEKSWVAIGRPTSVTGFLKADKQVHLALVLDNGEGPCRHWAAVDDGGHFLFESPSKIEVIDWIEQEVGEDALEVSYWDSAGRWIGLPMFSGSPGKTAHRVARMRRKAVKKNGKRQFPAQKRNDALAGAAQYLVQRGYVWD